MIFGIPVLLIVVAIVVIIQYYQRGVKQRKLLRTIQDKWGKPNNGYTNINLISSYLQATAKPDDLPSTSAHDLDMESIFAYIDRTNSKPGQQYLYKKLHQPKTDLATLTQLDDNVTKLGANRPLQEELELELTALNNNNAYYLHRLFTTEQKRPFGKALSFYISVSAIVTVVLVVLLFLAVNQYYFLMFLGMVIANLVIHYQSKSKIYAYTHSLPQLFILINIAGRLLKKVGPDADQSIKNNIDNLQSLKRSLSFINFESKLAADQTDIVYALWELLKTILLLEPLMFIISIKRINKYRYHIEQVFNYVAGVDVAISIQSVRIGLPYYCKPSFTSIATIAADALYHPLVPNCVPNSITTSADKGVLVTGSNMSGKTTFIRAIAINALLAQTLFTCCCRNYQAPLLKLHTSIRISDDLQEQKSYFKAEALSVLKIIEACEKARPLSSMVIIDEIFRGTNTIERVAAAKAVLAYLTSRQNFVLVSTHDLELAELLGHDYEVYSFEETVANTRLVFDYRMKPGLLKNKNGIAILQALGYPDALLTDASNVSEQLKKKYQL